MALSELKKGVQKQQHFSGISRNWHGAFILAVNCGVLEGTPHNFGATLPRKAKSTRIRELVLALI